MTFIAQERSQADGRPVELFLFKTALESTGTAFTNSETEITVGPETYEPIAIERTEPSYSNESDSGAIELTVSRELAFARRFISATPSDRYVVTVFRRHLTDVGLQTVTWWKGFISQVTFEGIDAKIRCNSLLELFTRIGPRMTFQQPCNHVLYDPRCTVSENTFRFQGIPATIDPTGRILSFTGLSTSAPLINAPSGFQGNFYVGGFMRTPDNVDHRLIVAQSVDSLTIQFPFFDSPAGLQLDVFAGCDHQIQTCELKFDNVLNHGGHPYLPVRNIYVKGLDSTGATNARAGPDGSRGFRIPGGGSF